MGSQSVFLKLLGVLIAFNLILVLLQAVGVPLQSPISYLDPSNLIGTFTVIAGTMLLVSLAPTTSIGFSAKWFFSAVFIVGLIFSYTFIPVNSSGIGSAIISFRDWLNGLIGISGFQVTPLNASGFTVGIGLCTQIINSICGVNTLTGVGLNVTTPPDPSNIYFLPFIFFLTIGVIAVIAGIMAMNGVD